MGLSLDGKRSLVCAGGNKRNPEPVIVVHTLAVRSGGGKFQRLIAEVAHQSSEMGQFTVWHAKETLMERKCDLCL